MVVQLSSIFPFFSGVIRSAAGFGGPPGDLAGPHTADGAGGGRGSRADRRGR